MGVDLSYVNQVEDYGGVYRVNGEKGDPFRILKEAGANTVRVRLWHQPQWVGALNGGKMYYDLEGTIRTLRRAREQGMAVNLDIHYSDRWADPHRQETPAAWKDLGLAGLSDSVYAYTMHVLKRLQALDLVPEMVQIGNETNQGMCWDLGKAARGDYAAFALLLNSGIRAVRDFSSTSSRKPRIILHVAQFQDVHAWAAGIASQGVRDFDILGVSHYTKWSEVKSMQGVRDSVRALQKRYGKDVMIVETAYPWTSDNADGYTNIFGAADTAVGYPISVDGQFRYLRDLTQAVLDGGGKGIMYWEPAWISSGLNDGWGRGSSWENNTLFNFNGDLLPSAYFMRSKYSLPR
jgi:arabinogalactan endo-1,4-beta-galactosidase